MKTTLRLDDNLILAAKSLAQTQRKTLGKVISELVLKGIQFLGQVGNKKSFPVFRIGSDAQLTLEHVKRL